MLAVVHLGRGVAEGRPGDRSVEELATRIGESVANTSRHPQILRRARVVETERHGKYILYRLAGETEAVRLLQALGQVGERNNAEINRGMTDHFGARDALEAVSRGDLVSRLRDGLVTVLDFRPEDEFALGHLPGALNIPFAELERGQAELPVDREVVACCRGPYSVLSFEAVAALRALGYCDRRLEDGYPERKAAGLTVEAGV